MGGCGRALQAVRNNRSCPYDHPFTTARQISEVTQMATYGTILTLIAFLISRATMDGMEQCHARSRRGG
ncbi:protein of unknown function [Candidatus Promineifilum breve]|uniref:Uncharacterized protein n=1 Tax=Candidatus Promineifilum breve TaxID=1806508 RepID=A0A161K2Y2_9CHLR|nr:protein of unknown function [Candidatus Promineifilum breve]